LSAPSHAQTDLEGALRQFSINGEALPDLYPVLAVERLYFAIDCEGVDSFNDTTADRNLFFAASEYRDGQLFYAFESQAVLDLWADNRGLTDSTCWVALTGLEFVDLLGPSIETNYTIINIDTAPVLISPDDWSWVNAHR